MSLDTYNFIKENECRIQYNLEEGIVLTPKNTNGFVCSSTGYLRAKLNRKNILVHQILAVQYFNVACIGKQVNHIDGNKLNNKKENLEMVSQQENLQHQKENSLLGESPLKKKIKKYDLNWNYICTYASIADAERETGISRRSISFALKGWKGNKRYTQTRGYRWRIC